MSDATDTCVYQTPITSTRICRCCGRLLPADNFYMRDRQHTSNSYCKECRKAANRQRRKNKMSLPEVKEDDPRYIVITRVKERETRLELILHALQVVHERIARQHFFAEVERRKRQPESKRRQRLLQRNRCKGKCRRNNENVDRNNENETFKTKNSKNVYQSTQSIAKESKVKQSIENPLLNSSPETGGTDFAAGKSAKEEEKEGKEEKEKKEKEQEMQVETPSQTRKTPHEWTDEDISRLTPPKDGLRRNLDGLVFNLRQLHIPLNEQYAIILKSNFGIIGHPMWEGFYTLRNCHGKIRQPGRYLLSLCKPASAKV